MILRIQVSVSKMTLKKLISGQFKGMRLMYDKLLWILWPHSPHDIFNTFIEFLAHFFVFKYDLDWIFCMISELFCSSLMVYFVTAFLIGLFTCYPRAPPSRGYLLHPPYQTNIQITTTTTCYYPFVISKINLNDWWWW